MDRIRNDVAAIVGIVLTAAVARADASVPKGLQPGDEYHLSVVSTGAEDLHAFGTGKAEAYHYRACFR